jgi:hypothetical protein
MLSEDAYETSPHGGSCGRIITLYRQHCEGWRRRAVLVRERSAVALFEPGAVFRTAEPLAHRSFRGRGRVCANSFSTVLNPKRRRVSLTALQYSNQSGVWLWPLHAAAHIPGNAEVPMERIGHQLRHITRGKFLLSQKLFAECILRLEFELPSLDRRVQYVPAGQTSQNKGLRPQENCADV